MQALFAWCGDAVKQPKQNEDAAMKKSVTIEFLTKEAIQYKNAAMLANMPMAGFTFLKD